MRSPNYHEMQYSIKVSKINHETLIFNLELSSLFRPEFINETMIYYPKGINAYFVPFARLYDGW